MSCAVSSGTVFLVRHARHSVVDQILVGRGQDVQLSDDGRQETGELARWFSDKRVNVVQSSPRRRARETAEPLAATLGTTAEIEQALDEIDFGRWTGLSFEELAPDPHWRSWNAARSTTRPPDGETMAEAQTRIVGHIERVGRRLGREHAIMVSHCDVIRAALLHVLNWPIDAWHQIDIEPASVSTIVIGSRGLSIGDINQRRVA
jgi:broad specificity phosphatase PhoE